MSNDIIQRLRSAARILIKGEKVTPTREVPAITADEVAEAKAFFPLDKYFYLWTCSFRHNPADSPGPPAPAGPL